MHTHFSATALLGAFLGVIFIGTLWRLLASHLVASNNTMLKHLGQGMAFQY